MLRVHLPLKRYPGTLSCACSFGLEDLLDDDGMLPISVLTYFHLPSYHQPPHRRDTMATGYLRRWGTARLYSERRDVSLPPYARAPYKHATALSPHRTFNTAARLQDARHTTIIGALRVLRFVVLPAPDAAWRCSIRAYLAAARTPPLPLCPPTPLTFYLSHGRTG